MKGDKNRPVRTSLPLESRRTSQPFESQEEKPIKKIRSLFTHHRFQTSVLALAISLGALYFSPEAGAQSSGRDMLNRLY